MKVKINFYKLKHNFEHITLTLFFFNPKGVMPQLKFYIPPNIIFKGKQISLKNRFVNSSANSRGETTERVAENKLFIIFYEIFMRTIVATSLQLLTYNREQKYTQLSSLKKKTFFLTLSSLFTHSANLNLFGYEFRTSNYILVLNTFVIDSTIDVYFIFISCFFDKQPLFVQTVFLRVQVYLFIISV